MDSSELSFAVYDYSIAGCLSLLPIGEEIVDNLNMSTFEISSSSSKFCGLWRLQVVKRCENDDAVIVRQAAL